MMDKYYVTLVVLTFLAWYFIASYNKNQQKKLELEKDRLDLGIELKLDYTDVLDKLIMDAFDEYRLLNLSYDDTYINKDREEEIISEVANLVSGRLSSTFIKQMAVYYNPSTIPDVISKKIYLVVMKYIIEHNQIKTDK